MRADEAVGREPADEEAAEQLLLDFPTRVLVTAVTDYTPSDAQLEGAARYFAGRPFREKKKGLLSSLPVELKQALLSHTLASPNAENIERARRAFG